MRLTLPVALLVACSPVVHSQEPSESRATANDRRPPPWALPPPEERALIDRLTSECRDYDAAIASLSAGQFLAAKATHRQAENVVEARRVAVLVGKTTDTTPATCFEDSMRLFTSTWFEMGVTLEEGLASANADERYEALFKVATSDTPLSKEARRRIGTTGLEHWLAQTRRRCDAFEGASETCLWPLRRLETIAPESNQAKQAAAVVADTRQLDIEMAPRILVANELLAARGKVCRHLNGSQCQWGYKNPEPRGKEKRPKYGAMLPGEEKEASLFELLHAKCKSEEDEEKELCAGRHEFLPRTDCPSYWDESPATQKLDQQWEALLREVPDGSRKQHLRKRWVASAHNCADGRLAMPGCATM